jgi:hypothetical protein
MGPAAVITVGVLFLLDQMHGGYFSFRNTFPVILIVIGAVSLASALAPMKGHISDTLPPSPPGTTQNPFPGPGQGR